MKPFNYCSKKVILRVDFNVPIKNGVITDDNRIIKSLKTIQHLIDEGAIIIILSHLGRPLKELKEDGTIDLAKFSLRPISVRLSELLHQKVYFAPDCGGEESKKIISQLKSKDIILLENTRFNKEEEKGNVEWAKSLAALGEYYINDAFGAAHREHASTATIARFFDKEHKDFGFLMEAETQNGLKVLTQAAKPVTAIVGGAKVSDKIELISNLMNFCDNILIGGGMAYTFFAAQGISIGNSLCEKDKLDLALELIEKAKTKKVNLKLPQDSIEGDQFSNDCKFNITNTEAIQDGYMGLDIGPRSIECYSNIIMESKTIIWNGPLGVFEMSNFENGTKQIAASVAKATTLGAFTLIGGGDSAAAINKFGFQDEVSFISTGGGAMLEMLEGKSLPGVEAILN